MKGPLATHFFGFGTFIPAFDLNAGSTHANLKSSLIFSTEISTIESNYINCQSNDYKATSQFTRIVDTN